ncbi:MAG: hypothetical protein JWP01_2472 [Myxococcales bacterium]|nr:hypothetical protein [Myxococcales bacterium]
MRHGLALLFLAPTLGGCSLLYNPSNIPNPDPDAGEPDAEVIVDADPSMLALTSVDPTVILEGQGDGGSRRAIVVVAGDHISETATITVTGGNVTAGTVTHALNHKSIAIELTAPVDTALAIGDVPLTITVQQSDGAGGMITRTIPDATVTSGLVLRNLPELTLTSTMLMRPAQTLTYSRIGLAAMNPPALIALSGSDRMELRAVSSITLPSLSAVGGAASGATGGPGVLGSCAGGAQGSVGGCSSQGGGGAGTGSTTAGGGGGGGGFGSMGTGGGGPMAGGAGSEIGDDFLVIYPGSGAASNRASGGGGGGAPSLLGSASGGGGGGGAIEITAGGNVVVGTINVQGGAGAASGSAGGGGGAGGSVLIRAGGTLMTTMILAKGGVGGALSSASDGGAGGDGRVRWDSPVSTAPGSDVATHRGLSFAPATPLVVSTTNARITVLGEPNAGFSFYTSQAGVDVDGATHTIGSNGSFEINVVLKGGLNKVCVTLAGGVRRSNEAETCIDVAFLPS